MEKDGHKFIGYVGTYTKGDSKGVYSFTLDTETPSIGEVKVAAELDSPTYLTISEDNKNLYAVAKEGDQGGLSAFAVNEQTGELTLLNSKVADGANPCHVSVNEGKSNVVTANYHTTAVKSFLTREDGSLDVVASVVDHEGSGPHERQEKPHLHYAGYSPDEKYVIAIDLGSDKIYTYEVNDGKLKQVQVLSTEAGSGPRHIAFHPNGKFAYVMTELSSEVIVLSYNEQDGSFTELQSISTIPEDFTENNQGSAIHITSDARFVYVGNRGHNSIAAYSINQDTGQLEFVAFTFTEGEWPRDFTLDPTEKFVVASNQNSSNLVLYSRNETTGELSLIQSDIHVPDPVCVKFLHA